MNVHEPGFLLTSGFSTGFVEDKYTSAVSSALWFWLQFELVCDALRNTVLVMPPPLSITVYKEKTKKGMGKLANTVDMAFLDASESWEERGELVVYGYSEFAWIRACVKAGLPDDPDYPDQQKWKPKKIMEIAC